MSYPRKLHILIIEDEQDPIDTYRELLAKLRDRYPSVEIVVRSFDDARAYIEGPQIVHLVILDLNLPLATRQQPADGIAAGEQLLDVLAQREGYPVPVVLIVSGRVNLTRPSELQHRLATDFWYGAIVNKGRPDLARDLEEGLQKAQQYCDAGVHIHDPGASWYPPISPREEDLLRRCVLSQASCLGVDLQWWGAEVGPSVSHPTALEGPTKVLMGRFLLDDGMETSRPSFFKLEPSGNGPSVCRDAGILDQKLRHVQVKCSLASRTRALLVTQSVTDGIPVPLDDYLAGDPATVRPSIPGLVDDIVRQLDQLGGSVEDRMPIRTMLWEWHDRDRIMEGLGMPEAIGAEPASNPMCVFDSLTHSKRLLWSGKRPCTHGDLNATNVAVGTPPGERPSAFIFDAAGIHADVDMRDLAMLEVTSLLFNTAGYPETYDSCFDLIYGDTFVPPELDSLDTLALVRNTAEIIASIRRNVERQGKKDAYALMVFDVALMQVAGLAIQPSRNKVIDSGRCRRLAGKACAWLLRIVPELGDDLRGENYEGTHAT